MVNHSFSNFDKTEAIKSFLLGVIVWEVNFVTAGQLDFFVLARVTNYDNLLVFEFLLFNLKQMLATYLVVSVAN